MDREKKTNIQRQGTFKKVERREREKNISDNDMRHVEKLNQWNIQ